MRLETYLKNRRTLRNIKRFSMENVLHPQNLADHGFNVANLYILICEMLGFQYTSKEIFLVMNHDFSECYTGDLNLPIKDKIHSLWEKVENEIIPKHIPTDSDIKQYFKEYSTSEKYDLFLFADAFEAYLYCEDEVSMGNKLLEPALNRYRDKLTQMNPELFFTILSIKKMEEEN